MHECRWMRRVERWFDGESREPEAIKRHIEECAACRTTLRSLERFRAGVQAVSVRQEIAPAQFPAFLEGIRERIDVPARRHTGIWAVASLMAASLIVAVSLFAVFTGGPDPVGAEHTVVESASTEVEGATVETQNSTDGTRAIVWVHRPRKDVL